MQELAWSMHNPKFFLPASMYERYPSHLHIDLMARAQVSQCIVYVVRLSVCAGVCMCGCVSFFTCLRMCNMLYCLAHFPLSPPHGNGKLGLVAGLVACLIALVPHMLP